MTSREEYTQTGCERTPSPTQSTSCAQSWSCSNPGSLLKSILSDPAIVSRTKSYGPADLGLSGIRDFFARHSCTRFCNPTWIRPAVAGPATFPKRQGTTMTPHPSALRP